VPCGTLLDSVSCRKALLNADRLDLQAADRRALDEVVFDVLGLTPGEREAVYEAVVNLVRARLERAQSV
jgi:gamma-glutamyl phosphate reductase